jgi:hypothetical protein
MIKNTFHGRRIPLKKSGIYSGNTTASWSSFFAAIQPATSVLGQMCMRLVEKNSHFTIEHWDLFGQYHVLILQLNLFRNRQVDIFSPENIE